MNYLFSTFLLASILLSAWSQDCPYGFSGENCKDECGIVNKTANIKIVGGVEAVANTWPSLVYLEFNYQYDYRFPGEGTKTGRYSSACGGTLIDRYTVLTAAHCYLKTVTQEDKNGKEREIPVRLNKYHKTFESMYTIYVGMHDTSTINDENRKLDGVKMEVHKFINVI